LHGDVILDPAAELTIAPGTRVIFEPPRAGEDLYQDHPYFIGSELIVRGRLMALGTAAEPIVFTGVDPQGVAGSWGGINIEDAPEAQFLYCRFEQANSAIHARQTQVKVEHSIFRHNLVGLRFHDTRLLVENSLFEENDTAIRFHFGAPVIRHNLIRDNHKGMFISEAPRDYRIEENSFIRNSPYQVSLGEGVRKNVDLRHNYWSETGVDLENHFFDGRLDDWLGVVQYLPVLNRAFLPKLNL
jgi:nitrous oxidase accessory protein NosD